MKTKSVLFVLIVIFSISFMAFYLLLNPPAPNLSIPKNEAMGVSLTPTFRWDSVSNGTCSITYRIQVSKYPDFHKPIIDRDGIKNTYYKLTAKYEFEELTRYYWRVNASSSGYGCIPGPGPWSEMWRFRTNK